MLKHLKPGQTLCGPFIVRTYADGKTLFAGTLDESPLPKAHAEELWVCEFQLLDVRRFKMPDQLHGLRIDQALTTSLDPAVLVPIRS